MIEIKVTKEISQLDHNCKTTREFFTELGCVIGVVFKKIQEISKEGHAEENFNALVDIIKMSEGEIEKIEVEGQ